MCINIIPTAPWSPWRNEENDGLKTNCSETPTAQHIIYNIHPGLFGTRVVLRKTSELYDHWSSTSLPHPTQKKNIHVLPKNVSPSNFPSPVCWPKDRFPGQTPSVNPSAADPCTRIHTQNPQVTVCWHRQEHASQTLLSLHGNNVRVATQTRMWLTSSEDLAPHPKSQIPQNEQEKTFPHQHNPVTCSRNGPGLSDHWTQSGG